MFFSKHKLDRPHAWLPAACAVSGVATVWSLHDTLGLASGALLIEADPASAPTDPRLPADLAAVLRAYRRYRGGASIRRDRRREPGKTRRESGTIRGAAVQGTFPAASPRTPSPTRSLAP